MLTPTERQTQADSQDTLAHWIQLLMKKVSVVCRPYMRRWNRLPFHAEKNAP